MNADRRKRLAALAVEARDLRERLEAIAQEENDARERLPENLQQGAQAATMATLAEGLEEAVDALGDIISEIEGAAE